MSDHLMSIRAAAAEQISAEVAAYGRRSLETGGFLLASRDDDVLSIIAFAGKAGISRCRDLFQVSERTLSTLFQFADDRDLYAPVQFHSHRLGAALSRTDREHGLRAEGFTSAVVPAYADPPDSLTDWGWWSFKTGAWVAATPPVPVTGGLTVAEFDEDGLRVR